MIKMKAKKLSAEEIANIHKLREEGLNGREIAERMGVSQKTIWYHLEEYRKKNNERCRKYQQNRRKRDPEWNAEKQREFRKKHPISYLRVMARSYLKRLPKEEIKRILKEIGYDR